MKVILDAIIPREDFEVVNPETTPQGASKSTISITDMEAGSFFLSTVKKPDFQRETNEWTAVKIIGLIESFINGDLIPALILWRSPSNNYTFVIDGSHRLSALAAWINDDYGDGKISKQFFDSIIPEQQLQTAERVRQAVRKQVGPFSEYRRALTEPEKVKPEIVHRSKLLASQAAQLQWVNGDAHKAEESFFKINQNAVPINKTELVLLRSRRKPQGIASRAISRSGTGHKYWASFTKQNQEKIEIVSKEINQMLFTPPLKSPIKTLDLPVGGKLYSQQTLALILEFICISNDIKEEIEINDDPTGDATVSSLSKTKKIAQRINSIDPSSFGLHPAVYFYSEDGRYKPASFYAVTLFVKRVSKHKNQINKFIEVREEFEHLLLENEYISEQIIRRWRSASAGYPYVADFYEYAIDSLVEGKTRDTIIASLSTNRKYAFITKPANLLPTEKQDFSSSTKSAIYMREALANALHCSICGGFIHANSITFDHIQRKRDGGLGEIENGDLAHPYCNSTYKN